MLAPSMLFLKPLHRVPGPYRYIQTHQLGDAVSVRAFTTTECAGIIEQMKSLPEASPYTLPNTAANKWIQKRATQVRRVHLRFALIMRTAVSTCSR